VEGDGAGRQSVGDEKRIISKILGTKSAFGDMMSLIVLPAVTTYALFPVTLFQVEGIHIENEPGNDTFIDLLLVYKG